MQPLVNPTDHPQRSSNSAPETDKVTCTKAGDGRAAMSRTMTAKAQVKVLDELFYRFDVITEKQGLEKIKPIGDCDMLASGVPIPSDADTAKVTSRMQSTGEPSPVFASVSNAALMTNNFNLTTRGTIEVESLGAVATFLSMAATERVERTHFRI